jgi:hypothetical protein
MMEAWSRLAGKIFLDSASPRITKTLGNAGRQRGGMVDRCIVAANRRCLFVRK